MHLTTNYQSKKMANSTLLLLLLLTTTTSRSSPIKNVIVLVMENRSFDHMLGWMKASVAPTIDGLDGSQCNSHPNGTLVCVSDDAHLVDPDPGHSFQDIKRQVFGGGDGVPDMSGFVQQASSMGLGDDLSDTVMRGFKPESVPIYTSLVREFAVFDRWFASLPASTQPNRLFVYSATSQGAISHDKFKLLKGFPQRTIFDSLHKDNHDFGIYSQSVPSTLFLRNLRKLKYVFRKFYSFSSFFDHARDGKLKELTVLEPKYFDIVGDNANDDHPSHDVGNGQKLVKQVYEALRASPQWNHSLLIITYDEHGGFYDHVTTPYQGVPSPDGIPSSAPEQFHFDRLGVRVPTIMVSPWIKRGTVVKRANGPTPSSEYEHSSIPATIKNLFNLSSDYLTSRDAWAGTFEDIVAGMTSPRTDCPELLPDPIPVRATEVDENRPVTEFQSELVQLAAAISGDIILGSDSYPAKKMTVKEANSYVDRAMAKFFEANAEAFRLGIDESTVVDIIS